VLFVVGSLPNETKNHRLVKADFPIGQNDVLKLPVTREACRSATGVSEQPVNFLRHEQFAHAKERTSASTRRQQRKRNDVTLGRT
jgi:hypothetical protein